MAGQQGIVVSFVCMGYGSPVPGAGTGATVGARGIPQLYSTIDTKFPETKRLFNVKGNWYNGNEREVTNMIMPRKVRIDTVDYSVEQIPKLIVDGRGVDGCITYSKHLIEIEPEIQDEQGMVQTMWHEILHGIMHERALSFKDTSEETLIDELSKGIYQVVKDNTEFIRVQIEKKNTEAFVD